MRELSRRELLQRAAVLAAATPIGCQQAYADKKADAVTGDTLRVAVVGVNGRGMSAVDGFAGKNNCKVTHVCDCDEGVIGKAMKTVEKVQGKAPKFVKDFRGILEAKDIDVVSIATPNHWHALMAVWALRAGKDVYVEKPVSHNVREGRLIVEAARKANRVCQTGTQSRSNPGMRQSIEYVHSGKIGKVSLAYGTCFKRRNSIGKSEGDGSIPKSCDYDLWCGPAPKVPLKRKKLHYDWHWVWDTGNGDLGNQGIHEMDKARWGLNKQELPKGVVSMGGRFGYLDDGQTANTQLTVFNYGDSELIFEVRGLESDSPFPNGMGGKKGGNFVGNVWFGPEGVVVCPSYSTGFVLDPTGKVVKEFKGGSDQHHFDNFVKAVRGRDSNHLNADILEGHLSSALCHLGNISYRLGREAEVSEAVAAVSTDAEARKAVERMGEHLKSVPNVDLQQTPFKLGKALKIDPKAETFVGDAKADEMLTREYRKGFDFDSLG